MRRADTRPALAPIEHHGSVYRASPRATLALSYCFNRAHQAQPMTAVLVLGDEPEVTARRDQRDILGEREGLT
jgi:hypothetical protein